MSQAQAAPATVTDIDTVKIKVGSITKAYEFNKSLISVYNTKLKELNSRVDDQTLQYDGLIHSNIKKLKDATGVLNKVTELSKSIQDSLAEAYRLRDRLDYLQTKSYDIPAPEGGNVQQGGVIIRPDGVVIVDVPFSQSAADSRPLNTTQSGELNRQPVSGAAMWVGGSKTNQVGGRGEAYTLPPDSYLYPQVVTRFEPLTPENNPGFYEELKEAILNKTIQPVLATTDTENESASRVALSPAAQSVMNPNVIKNLIMNLDATTEDARTGIIKKYEDLVMMCDKTTALKLIKPMLNLKEGEKAPSDEKLLTMLGWNGTVNELLYDINKGRKGGLVFAGLFSFFCFYNGNFSVGFSRYCGRNYVCMLNWVIIAAFRLKIRDPAKYTDALIIELIEKMHHALFGFLLEKSTVDNFTKNTVGNTGFYVIGSKTSMKDDIFDYGNLKVLVEGIKSEVQKIPEPSSSDGGLYQHNTTHKPPTHKTVKRRGHKGGNKVTTHKHHRHPTLHNVAHTVKVAQKPTDVNIIKTRRNHHAVKT